MRKWEISLFFALAATLIVCAISPETFALRWWTTAFAPLCDGILSGGAETGEIVLRSRVWELLTALG